MFRAFFVSSRVLILAFAAMVLVTGCAPSYVLKAPPTADTKSFKNVEVAKVEVGVTESELEPETPLELRTAIIEQVQKKKLYEKVAAEFDLRESTLLIQPKIAQFDKGSRTARYFIGFGAGKARYEVICKFVNKTTQEMIAEGTFKAEVKRGLFGGGTNQKTMSESIAMQVAQFLKKGK